MTTLSPRPASRLAPLFESIGKGRFQPVYVLFGADSAAAAELVRLLKAKLIAPGLEAFDFESLHADDTPVVTALQHARQPAVGSPRRMVVIRNAERLHAKQREELCVGLKALAESDHGSRDTGHSTVVVTSDEDGDFARALSAAGLSRFVVDLRQRGAGDLQVMLQRWAEELGLVVEPAAARLLVELSGEDTTVLRSETEKLASAVEPGTKVTPEVVRRVAGRSRDFELKEYVNNLVQGRTGPALVVLERLAAWGEPPHTIVNWLTNGLMWLAADLAAGRADRAAHGLDVDYVRRCLLQLYEINRAMLTGHPEPFVLLQEFTVCAACPGTSRYCGLSRGSVQPEFCIRRVRSRAAKRRAYA